MTPEQWLEYAILNYLMNQPSAKDTLEGIAEWWLLKEKIICTVDMVSNSVNGLVAKGYLVQKKHQDQSRVYEVNKEKLEEIKSSLKEMIEVLATQSIN